MSTRPVFRVASAGLDPRDVRLIGIVFQHSQYNKYDFRMLEGIDLAGTDILIANPVDPAGLDAIASLGAFSRRIPCVSAVPRGAQASARYSVTIDRLTLQLLPILNRVVEAEALEPAAVAVADPAIAASAHPAAGQAIAASGENPADAAIGTAAAAAAPVQAHGRAADGSPAVEPASAPQGEPEAVDAARAMTCAATNTDRIGQAPAQCRPEGLQALAELPVLHPQPRASNARGGMQAAPSTPAAVSCDGGSPAPAALSSAGEPGGASPVTLAAAGAIALAAQRATRGPWHLDAAQAYLPWNGQAQLAPPRARLQALVADPSPAAQQQLARLLGRMGLEVHCVSCVAAAMLRVCVQHTDLVITERGLSDGDGFDLIRQLRAQAAYRYTPVLLLRSRLHVLDATRARLAGEVTLLAKPLTRQALESLVRQALRKSAVLDDLSELLSPS